MKPGYILCAECGQEHGVWVECVPLRIEPDMASCGENAISRHASSEQEATWLRDHGYEVVGDPPSPMECGERKVLRVEGEEEPRVYYCSLPQGHSGAHIEAELMWP